MKKFVTLAVLALCASASPTLALDLQSFHAKVQKFTTAPGKPIRAVCICKEAGSTYLKAGYLISSPGPAGSFQGIGVGCAVPLFYASDGSAAPVLACNTSFEVLGK